MNKKSLVYATALASVALLSGCAGALTIGEPESQCGAYEAMQGTACMSVRDLYKASEGSGVGGTGTSQPQGAGGQAQGQATGKPYTGKGRVVYDKNGLPMEDFRDIERAELEKLRAERDSFGAPKVYGNGTEMDPSPWMQKPTPIRSQPKVQRIWIAPYEDYDGDLLAPGVLYTEIENRKWNIGEQMVTKPKSLAPVQTFSAQGGEGGSSPSSNFGAPGLGGLPQGGNGDGFDLEFLKQQLPTEMQRQFQ